MLAAEGGAELAIQYRIKGDTWCDSVLTMINQMDGSFNWNADSNIRKMRLELDRTRTALRQAVGL